MPADLQKLLTRFSTNVPVNDEALTEFEERSHFALPKAYKAFLKFTNGGDGFIGKDRYVILWCLEKLLSLNESYQVGEWAPGLLLFGSDGGGEAFGFDMRSRAIPIVSVPFIGGAIETANVICSDFDVFLEGEF